MPGIFNCRRLQNPSPAEVQQLATLQTAVFNGTRSRRVAGLQRLATMDPGRDMIFVAEQNKKIIGFIHLQACKKNNQWINRGTGVAARYRRQGIGSSLLSLAIESARRKGAAAVISYTDKDNIPSLTLHERIGFKKDLLSRPQPELRYRLCLSLV
ncbi:MAG: GNAT family N-acetyltransferase [Thermodesulfobacteriota bacterium]|nr:GNAT family N-acetyltransferase [Thermodesulfobacteriota bacterium]